MRVRTAKSTQRTRSGTIHLAHFSQRKPAAPDLPPMALKCGFGNFSVQTTSVVL